jgi:hypothetical protein
VICTTAGVAIQAHRLCIIGNHRKIWEKRGTEGMR